MYNLKVGDVVVSKRSFFLIVEMISCEVVLCPFIPSSELRHRADLELTWGDLNRANLSFPDMRLRAIPSRWQRQKINVIGTMRAEFVARVSEMILKEIRRGDCPLSGQKIRGRFGRDR